MRALTLEKRIANLPPSNDKAEIKRIVDCLTIAVVYFSLDKIDEYRKQMDYLTIFCNKLGANKE